MKRTMDAVSPVILMPPVTSAKNTGGAWSVRVIGTEAVTSGLIRDGRRYSVMLNKKPKFRTWCDFEDIVLGVNPNRKLIARCPHCGRRVKLQDIRDPGPKGPFTYHEYYKFPPHKTKPQRKKP
jgi:hypothetical protein